MNVQPLNPIELFRESEGFEYIFDSIYLSSICGIKLAFQPAVSPRTIEFLYPPIAGKINKEALFLAQQLARFAVNCTCEKARSRYINRANYHLTEAYKGGEEHQYFWGQFI